MRRFLVYPSLLAFLASSLYARPRARRAPGQAVAAPQRDPQAVALIQQAVAALGGSAPSDSTATGAMNTLSLNLSGLPTWTFGVDSEGRVNGVNASSGQNPVTATAFNSYSSPPLPPGDPGLGR